MTKPITLLLFSFFLFACSTGEKWPDDLEGKRKLLVNKQSELNDLRQTIRQLEEEISALDDTPKKSKLVTASQLNKSTFQHFVDIQATVQSDDIVYGSSETGGRILRLPVDEGQNIRRGQLIASLDLETLQNQIEEVTTSLDLATTVFERQEQLWKQNIGSEIQYLEAKANKDRLEKSLATLQTQLRKGNVYAPISGVVDKKFKESGEMVAPGEPIVQILNTKKVKVVADVPENYLGKINKGEQVTLKFPALDQELTARVSLIGSSINPANRTFKVEVEIPNPSGLLKPNLLAIMLVKDHESKETVTVPIELVQQEVSGRSFVMVVDPESDEPTTKKAYVQTGLSYEGIIEIKEGLEGDELLIVEGARNLSENESITIQDKPVATENEENIRQ